MTILKICQWIIIILKIIRSRVSSHGHSQMVVNIFQNSFLDLQPAPVSELASCTWTRADPRLVYACNDLFLIYKAPPLRADNLSISYTIYLSEILVQKI